MSNFKGTKGKWCFGEGMPNGQELEALRVKTNDVASWDICAVWDDLNPNEGKANALLISKAPEMLEMLEECLTLTESLNPKSRISNQIRTLIKEATEL